MEEVGVEFQLDLDESEFDSSLTGLTNSLLSLKAGLEAVSFGTGVITDLISNMTELGMAFDETSAKVSTLFGSVEVDTEHLTKQVLELSNATGIAATEINEGLYQALSSGVIVTEDMTEAMDLMTNSAMLSIAGFTSIRDAVDITTTIMNAFSLSIDDNLKIMNVLIETQNAGKTTVDELARSMGAAIPSAASLGISFEELAASVAVLTKNGISTFRSMTMLKALFADMTKESSSTNEIWMEMNNETIPEFIEGGGSLIEVLNQITDYLDENNQAWQSMAGSQWAWSAASTLSRDNAAELTTILARLSDSTYELIDAYEAMQTPQLELNRIQQSWNNMLIEFWEDISPNVTQALSVIADNMEWLGPLVLKLTLAFAGLTVAIGSLIIIKFVSTVFVTSMKSIGAAMMGIISPAGAAVVAIGLVVVALLKAMQMSKKGYTLFMTDFAKSMADYNTRIREDEEKYWESSTEAQEIAYEKKLDSSKKYTKDEEDILNDSLDKRLELHNQYNEEEQQMMVEHQAQIMAQQSIKDNGVETAYYNSITKLLKAQYNYNVESEKLDTYLSENKITSREDMSDKELEIVEQLHESELASQKEYNTAAAEYQAVVDQSNFSVKKAFLADVSELQKLSNDELLDMQKEYEDKSKVAQKEYHSEVKAEQDAFQISTLGATKTHNDETVIYYKNSYDQLVQITKDGQGNIERTIKDSDGNIIKETEVTNKKVKELYEVYFSQLPDLVAGELTEITMDEIPIEAKQSAAEAVRLIGEEIGKTEAEINQALATLNITPVVIPVEWEEIPLQYYDPEKVASASKAQQATVPITTQQINVPMLAKGGIVDQPTLSMIGEAGPEMVLPLNSQGASFIQSLSPKTDNNNSIINNNTFNVYESNNANDTAQAVDRILGDLLLPLT